MTNPDMLHLALLPDHARWADFFFRLSLVVVDEAHVCRGVFGSHVAMVLRRLRRLVAHYGGRPALVPGERDDRQPRRARDAAHRARRSTRSSPTRRRAGEKLFALWNPPIIDEDTGRAAERAHRGVVADGDGWSSDDIRTIGFTPVAASRGAAGRVRAARAWATRRSARGSSAYRAGYLAEDRRELERAAGGRRAARRRRRRTRSSSGSTSARSTRRVLDRLPGHARLDVAAGRARGPAGRRRRSRCWWRRTTRSTSTSCSIPRTCSTSRPRRR